MGQDICIRKDEKPLGYDWECGHEELYVRVNMYYNGSLYIGLWQEQKECEEKLELFGDLTIGVMGLPQRKAIFCFCGKRRIRKYNFTHWKWNRMGPSGKKVQNLTVRIRILMR